MGVDGSEGLAVVGVGALELGGSVDRVDEHRRGDEGAGWVVLPVGFDEVFGDGLENGVGEFVDGGVRLVGGGFGGEGDGKAVAVFGLLSVGVERHRV